MTFVQKMIHDLRETANELEASQQKLLLPIEAPNIATAITRLRAVLGSSEYIVVKPEFSQMRSSCNVVVKWQIYCSTPATWISGDTLAECVNKILESMVQG